MWLFLITLYKQINKIGKQLYKDTANVCLYALYLCEFARIDRGDTHTQVHAQHTHVHAQH